MTYRKPIPPAVRMAVLKRANHICEDCQCHTSECGRLELHHLTYLHFNSYEQVDDGPIFGRETEDDLLAICRNCHHAAHRDPNGDYWLNPQDMADHWWYYYNEQEKD